MRGPPANITPVPFASPKIRCKECQATIAVPSIDFEQDDDQYGDAAWAEPAPPSPPRKRRPAAKKTTAASAAGFTLRKLFGVLALLLAAVMCLGVGMNRQRSKLF